MEKLRRWLGLTSKNSEGPQPLGIFGVLFVAILVILLIGGCETRAGCASWDYIYVSEEDTLETKRQVLAHNLILKELCA